MVIYRGSDNVKRKNSPSAEAKNALRKLYDFQQSQTPYKLTLENFYPVDVECLTKILGWKVEKRDIAGYSKFNEPLDAILDYDQRTVFLSTGDNVAKGRLNFSLAHEIGHMVLHGEEGYSEMNRTRLTGGKKTTRFSLLDQYEVEADRFAAELLMPEKAVRAHFSKLFGQSEIVLGSGLAQKIIDTFNRKGRFKGEITRKELSKWVAIYKPSPGDIPLAGFFDVSAQAMSIRLMDLLLVLE